VAHRRIAQLKIEYELSGEEGAPAIVLTPGGFHSWSGQGGSISGLFEGWPALAPAILDFTHCSPAVPGADRH
jgi:hypothetical protein